MMNLLDEKSLDKVANSAGTLWKSFVTFGSANEGVLVVFIIVRLIKLIINTNITWTLFSIYGCGIYLLAAIWSSVTHLLLYLGKSTKTEQEDRNEEEQQSETFLTPEELRPISLSSPENCHSAYNISIRKSYKELRNLLDSN